MAQQLALIVLVDVDNALKSETLTGNIYLFDNMRPYGSQNEGTGDLVTAVPGAYWRDFSQASEQVLNWLSYALGSIPPTVPRNYQSIRAQQTDRAALAALSEIAAGAPAAGGTSGAAALKQIGRRLGARVRTAEHSRALSGQKVLDVTGAVVTDHSENRYSYPAPIITDIYGEAVDEKIIYPAQYGSPDLKTDGWYWSATVDTSRPGTYTYTMAIQLHDLVQRDGRWIWEPVSMTYDSRLRITTDPMRNGFTHAGTGYLPMIPNPAG